jgi:23S rRNA pseudouridine1911/1915/1917 synthase
MDKDHWTIIFKNNDIIIVNKECGISSQGSENDIIAQFKKQFNIELYPITRLDQPVSGIVLYAKTSSAARHYSLYLTQKKIYKEYTAVVEGHFPMEINRIETNLIKKGNKAYENKSHGKSATLNIIKIQHLDKYSILKINIETGFFHQIRAQLSIAGYPIKGDLKYGSKRSNKEGGIYLHCHLLKLAVDREDMIFIAPHPADKKLYQHVNEED